jgi:hypothetical protein
MDAPLTAGPSALCQVGDHRLNTAHETFRLDARVTCWIEAAGRSSKTDSRTVGPSAPSGCVSAQQSSTAKRMENFWPTAHVMLVVKSRCRNPPSESAPPSPDSSTGLLASIERIASLANAQTSLPNEIRGARGAPPGAPGCQRRS